MKDTSVAFVKEILLGPSGLNENQLLSVLGKAMGPRIDQADIYLQHSLEERWSLEDGLVKEGGFSIDKGFGLRVVSQEKTGFAYADAVDVKLLEEAVYSARQITQGGGQGMVKINHTPHPPSLYPMINPLESASDIDK